MRTRYAGRAWLRWPAAGLLAWFIHTIVPGEKGGAAAVSAATAILAVALMVAGIRRTRTASTRAWLIFAGGMICWAAGDVIFAVNQVVLHHQPYPSWADLCYLGAYPLFLLGLLGLTRHRGPRDLAPLLDTAVIATGLALVYWTAVIGPIAEDAGTPGLSRLVTVAYPSAAVLMFAVAMPLVVRARRSTPSLWLLAVGSAVCVAGNAIYTLAPAADPDVIRVMLGAYPFAYLCFAGAARHASANVVVEVGAAERFGKARLAAMAASTLLVPGVLVVQGLIRPADIDWLAAAIGSIVVFLLVLARLAGFVTKVQVQAAQLAVLANRDELSGLPNRRLFERSLRTALAAGPIQVAMIDLNGFKGINDRFGHAVGDRLLVVVGERLAGVLRGGDLVARMGGDEFAVLVAGTSAETMDAIVDRLTTALRRAVDIDTHELLITASVGAADSTGTDDAYEVLRRADVAMYASKASGDGRYRRYGINMDEQASKQDRLGEEMRKALDTGQFHLVYQPIVSLPDGRIASVEALVRWTHPDRDFIGPDEFIPVAEQNGLIVELGAWILRTACAQAVVWRNALGDAAPQGMSVNVSARQLAEPGFAEVVAGVLAWTGLGAQNLIVEVTETAVFGGGQAVQAVKALHELGVKIALDDFGTGHSSLGLLQTVPVDILKVDKSFVDNITMAGRHAVIATALIQVSNGLGLMAVAEGVETAEQAAELHRLGYRLAQGYHFGRPVPEPDFGAAALDALEGRRR
jgi:diguanylate cyclase (GGDEF)-like protein